MGCKHGSRSLTAALHAALSGRSTTQNALWPRRSMAFTLKMKRGFYCSLSLRATTLILASVSVLLSLNNFVVSDLIVYHDYETPDEVIRDDFDVVYDPTTVVIHYHEATTHEPEHANVAQTADPHHREFYYIIVTLLIFDGINTVLALADMIVTCLLIFGAARTRSTFILLWLYFGVVLLVYDAVYIIAHLAIGMHFIYTIGTLFHILLVAYLWAVAWNLYEDCRDAELRAAAARVSMTVVTKDNPCTVSYNQLSSA